MGDWQIDGNMRNEIWDDDCAAPTLTEILAWIPLRINNYWLEIDFDLEHSGKRTYEIKYSEVDTLSVLHCIETHNFIEATGFMLIWLAENGYVKFGEK